MHACKQITSSLIASQGKLINDVSAEIAAVHLLTFVQDWTLAKQHLEISSSHVYPSCLWDQVQLHNLHVVPHDETGRSDGTACSESRVGTQD